MVHSQHMLDLVECELSGLTRLRFSGNCIQIGT
jgi:hypothetical protein